MPYRFDGPRWAFAAVGVAAILFLSVNVLSEMWLGKFRLDATQGRAYSVSDQIKPLLANIDEPITVRLYYSESLGAASPKHGALYRRVRDLLKQYATLSNGKIKVVFENPEPYSDTEDRAVGFGLQAVPLNDLGEVAYFGLAATNAVDEQQVIPFFNLDREQFVEYDLTKLIYSLSKPAQSKIGLISSLPVMGGMAPGMQMTGRPAPPWAVMTQIKDFFEVQDLTGDLTEIPKDINLLMLVQPTSLSANTQYAIDQFVLRGGRLLVFVDPNPESGGFASVAGNMDGIKKLMTAWGVSLVNNKVAGDLDAAIRVNSEAGDKPTISDYVAWLQLGDANLDKQDAIIGDVKQINMGTAGILEKVQGASTTVTPLLMTGPKSMRIDTLKVQGVPDVVALFRDFAPSGKRETLAARITGTAKTAFPEGPPSGKGGDNALKVSTAPIQVVVVADTDMLSDRFWTQQGNFMGQTVAVPTADNANFVINALENLTGSPALSSLRGRGVQNRPFVLVEAIRRDAEMKFRAKEKALEDRLDGLQKKIKAIEVRQGNNDAIQLNDSDRAMIDGYRSEILTTRHDLRDVQAALRRDIDRLEAVIKFLNIAAAPLIFGVVMIVVTIVRRRRAAKA
jgi:ABC-type uncharacterized transport system involved in gliding motility auxiliary subunit